MKNYLTNRANGLGFNFFDDFFDDFFKPSFYHGNTGSMRTDIKEKDDALTEEDIKKMMKILPW